MQHRGTIKLFSAILGLGFWLGPSGTSPVARAQPAETAETITTEYQYAAKAVCSLLFPHQDGTLAKGTYRTIVNIHNPSEKTVTIAAKVALATAFGTDPGPFSVTPFKRASLQADGGRRYTCHTLPLGLVLDDSHGGGP